MSKAGAYTLTHSSLYVPTPTSPRSLPMTASRRACEADLSRVKGELSAALERMVQHRLWVSQRIEAAAHAGRAAHDAVQASTVPV